MCFDFLPPFDHPYHLYIYPPFDHPYHLYIYTTLILYTAFNIIEWLCLKPPKINDQNRNLGKTSKSTKGQVKNLFNDRTTPMLINLCHLLVACTRFLSV